MTIGDSTSQRLKWFQDRLWAYIEADEYDSARDYVAHIWPSLSASLPYDTYCDLMTGVLDYLGMVVGILEHEATHNIDG